MELRHCLELIPRDCVRRGLKLYEDIILRRVTGDVNNAQMMYRMICRSVVKLGRFPEYEDLPERMRSSLSLCGMQRRWRYGPCDNKQFGRICARMLKLLCRASELYIHLDWLPRPTELELHEMAVGEDEGKRLRGPRVEEYRKQVRRIERRYRVTKDGCRDKPTPKPVLCVEMNREFPSTRAAADYITHMNCELVRRSDIRTAIRHGHKCGTWMIPADHDLTHYELTRCGDDGMMHEPEPRRVHLSWRYVNPVVSEPELMAA